MLSREARWFAPGYRAARVSKNRDSAPDFEAVVQGLKTTTTVAAVFDNRVAAEDFLQAVKEADLGLSVNISTSIDGAGQCCHASSIPRYSVGYSLANVTNPRAGYYPAHFGCAKS